MNCPVCGKPMEKGGILAERAIIVAWYPESEYKKTGLKRLVYRGGKLLGRHYPFRGLVAIDDAWYCPRCKKVTGIFDVTADE